MKAGRPHKTPTALVTTELNVEAVANATNAVDELAMLDQDALERTEKLALKLGYDGPTDPDVIERGVTMQMRRTVEACLETGRMLLLLKERVGHGSFMARLQRLGVEYKGAAKFMQAALRFSNVATSRHLATAVNSSGKLIEFLTLDNDEITELATEGSVLGITSDEFGAMTVRETREALRAKKALLEDKSKKIDTLVLENEALRKWKPKPEDVARTAEQKALLTELDEASNAAYLSILRLAVIADKVMDAHPDQPLAQRARGGLDFIATTFANLGNTHGVTVDMDALLQPPIWLGEGVRDAVADFKAANDAPAKKR